TLHISEVLGIQERHLNFFTGVVEIRQRYYRGDVDATKTDGSTRDVPMGHLAPLLKTHVTGDPNRHAFRPEDHHKLGYYARKLGIKWRGLGGHSLRREAVTDMNARLGTTAAMKLAGHSSVDQSLNYTLADRAAQENAVKARQEALEIRVAIGQ